MQGKASYCLLLQLFYSFTVVDTNNGSRAWDDLLRFKNGVGELINCHDGNCLFKVQSAGKCSDCKHAWDPIFFRNRLYKILGFRITWADEPRYNILINARGAKVERKNLSVCVNKGQNITFSLGQNIFIDWRSQVESRNRLTAQLPISSSCYIGTNVHRRSKAERVETCVLFKTCVLESV